MASEAARSRSPQRKTDVAKVLEITDLCSHLQAGVQSALEKAGGDSKRVVLVLDLDETAFTPLTEDGLATSVWFEDIMQRWAPLLKESHGMTFTQTLQEVLAVVDAFYSRIDVGLTDAALPAMLSNFKHLGVASMGVTARRPELASATWAQMGSRFKLEFDSLSPGLDRNAIQGLEKFLRVAEHVPDPACWEGLSCERGVWFTANVKKGSLLRKLLEPDMHVIFADDSLRHLEGVGASLDGYAASVTLFHFTAATSAAKKKLDAASCDLALAGHCAALFAEQHPGFLKLVEQKQTFLGRFITGLATARKQAKQPIDSPLQELAQALSD